jgi:large subunit ribosomal protein L4
MKLTVYSSDGTSSREEDFPGLPVFEGDKGLQAVKEVIVAINANRRLGTHSTKTRGEVSGNNKKIYRQKGTGNARHGDKRAPIFVGGGVVFGPRPRDYSKKVSKTVRKLALRRVLGDLVRGGKITVIDTFSIADGKTKSFVAAVNAISAPGKILIIGNSFDESTYLAARNVAWVQLVTGSDVNVEQLLLANSVIIVGDALQSLAQRSA